MPRYRIYQGDVLVRLSEIPSESVHCAVTSPPYWGLRDYGADEQLGLEKTPEEYVDKMVVIFRELRRVLRSDGTLWLNLGDSYVGGGNYRGTNEETLTDKQRSNGGARGQLAIGRSEHNQPVGLKVTGMKPKDLVGIPWMVAFALRADGWYLRSDIVWSKPNPMPESVTDRPTKSHEYIFLLSKSPRYYFDAEAVKENSDPKHQSRYASQFNAGVKEIHNGRPGNAKNTTGFKPYTGKRNIRSVWVLSTQPFKGAHFATFPTKLVDRCIRAATSSEGACEECGAPYARVVEKAPGLPRERDEIRNCPPGTGSDGRNNISGPALAAWREENPHVFKGWHAQCNHKARIVPAVVLDPFSGSGTTGVSANALGRDYIGIELNPEYVAMSEDRLFNPQPSFMDLMRDQDDIRN